MVVLVCIGSICGISFQESWEQEIIIANDSIRLSKPLGFLRVGMAVPALRVADIDFNVAAIIDTINKARGMDIQVLAFPEMSVTGYTLGDLVHQQALLSKAIAGLEGILKESAIGRSTRPVIRSL